MSTTEAIKLLIYCDLVGKTVFRFNIDGRW